MYNGDSITAINNESGMTNTVNSLDVVDERQFRSERSGYTSVISSSHHNSNFIDNHNRLTEASTTGSMKSMMMHSCQMDSYVELNAMASANYLIDVIRQVYNTHVTNNSNTSSNINGGSNITTNTYSNTGNRNTVMSDSVYIT